MAAISANIMNSSAAPTHTGAFQALSQHDPHHNYHKYYTITTTTVTTTIIVITSAAPYTCLLNILNICFVTGFFCNRGTKRMFCNSDIPNNTLLLNVDL